MLGRTTISGIAMFMAVTWSTGALSAWTSGGGELLGADTNPWFVQASPVERVLTYCIVVDEANFGVEKRDLSTHVRQSFQYWSDEFSSAVTNNVWVARELFVERDTCDGHESIKFQFGILDPEQERQFAEHGQDPRRFVAVAIRTTYDEVRLEGKGFVYVSPPRGPLAMHGTDLVDDPWNSATQSRLDAVIKHELGHVFGLQHTGDQGNLMNSTFPESLVSRQMNGWFTYGGVFRIPQGTPIFEFCGTLDHLRQISEFYGAAGEFSCLRYAIAGDRFVVSMSQSNEAPWITVGSATFEDEIIVRLEPLVRVWLPQGQTKFANPQNVTYLSGPMVKHKQIRGTYRSLATGVTRQVHLHLSPGRFQIGGIWNESLIMDLNYLR